MRLPGRVVRRAARYGRRAAVITRTGDDPFGAFIHQALHGYGVDDRYVTAVAELPTPADGGTVVSVHLPVTTR